MTAPVDADDEAFARHRGVLMGVAYRVLGRVVDAEDVVQDAWLRWRAVDTDTVADPKGYLVRVVTRLAIDRLRSAQAQRESYVGDWLPEPVLTEPDAAAVAEHRETLSLALLAVLERLSPLERAVFVLHEAFDYPYAEIADIIDRDQPAVRQLAHRAREHVQAHGRRYDADQRVLHRATQSFIAAAMDGDVARLLTLVAPDVRLVSDGGGKAKAPHRTIIGADKVSRFLATIATTQTQYPGVEVHEASVNGGPALVAAVAGEPVTVFVVYVADGAIQEVQMMANPDKLTGVRSRPAPS
ncbi:MAG: RNA polymerase sigma factor SigJ [Streptosporangiales bacterium]